LWQCRDRFAAIFICPWEIVFHSRVARSLIAESKHLEEPSGTHAAADAHGYDDPTHAAAFALDQRMANHARARHPIGVTDRDRAAIDIVPVGIDAEPVSALESLYGEGFIELQ